MFVWSPVNVSNLIFLQTFNDTEVLSFAPILADEFQKLARDELGTMTMQAAFDRLEYEPKPENSAKWDLDSVRFG